MMSLCDTKCMLLKTLNHKMSSYSNQHVWSHIVTVDYIDDGNVKVMKFGTNSGSKIQFSTVQVGMASVHLVSKLPGTTS